jgi:hypothetical protein
MIILVHKFCNDNLCGHNFFLTTSYVYIFFLTTSYVHIFFSYLVTSYVYNFFSNDQL